MKITYLSSFGDDKLVANTARVSMSKWEDGDLTERDEKLIKYLANHRHESPFFHPKVMFRVEVPFAIARQWERHRIGVTRSFDTGELNERSRRYVDDSPEFFVPTWRKRPDGSIKQGSGDEFDCDEQIALCDAYVSHLADCKRLYEYLLTNGVAPEQARFVLPTATYTQWVETGSLHYWARFVMLRADHHAQQEIQELANQISDKMSELYPISWAALMSAMIK